METRNKNIFIRDAVLATAGIILIFIFILTTNPQVLSAVSLLILPLLIALTSFIFIKLFIEVFTNLSSSHAKQLSAILAIGPTLIVLLGSLHQLGVQDLLLSVFLVVGIGWYTSRLKSNQAR